MIYCQYICLICIPILYTYIDLESVEIKISQTEKESWMKKVEETLLMYTVSKFPKWAKIYYSAWLNLIKCIFSNILA